MDYTTLPTDHLAAVVRGDADLDELGAALVDARCHVDGLFIVDERLDDSADQIGDVVRRRGHLLGLLGRLDETLDGIGRLGSLADPVFDAREVELDDGRIHVGVVATDLLDDLAIAACARIGDDDAVDGVLLSAMAGEANLDCHLNELLYVMRTRVMSRNY